MPGRSRPGDRDELTTVGWRIVQRALATAARAWPERYADWVAPDEELLRACAFLDLSVDAEQVTAAAATVSALVGTCAFVVVLGWALLGGAVAPSLAAPFASVTAVTVGWVAFSGICRAPVLAAAVARTRAVGDAATVASALALSLRLAPVPERAARFAANAGTGPLHRSLADHADHAAVTGAADGGLSAFAAEWREWFPALDRSVALLLAAVDADVGNDRTRLLDRAVAAVEDDLRDRTASFAGDLRAPVTGLYAFGVLLPLALVGTLPAAVAAGVPVPPRAFVVTYDLVLPVAVAVAAGRLLLRRPVAIPAPQIDATHPDVPDRRGPALLAAAATATAGWFAAPIVAGEWASPVLAVGGGGVGLCVHLHPRREVRRTVDERDRGLSDALALLGRRVADGEAVERALPVVAASLSGPTADALAEASRRRSALGIPVGRALAGDGAPFGPARGSGGRAAGAVTAIAAAATEGRPAGDALVTHGDRLDALAAAERAARRELATVTGTLRDTAALFGPLVGGATVALAGRLDDLGGFGGSGPGGGIGSTAGDIGSTAGAVGHTAGDAVAAEAAALSASLVGPVVGVYVLSLAATLTVLATGLEHGFDRTVVGYRVGLALVTASGAFVAGHAAVAILVG